MSGIWKRNGARAIRWAILFTFVAILGPALAVEQTPFDNCGSAAGYLSTDAAAHFQSLPTFERGFRSLSPGDGFIFNEAFHKFPPKLSIYTFANFWAWAQPHSYEVIRYQGAVLMRARTSPPDTYHSMLEPMGVSYQERAKVIQAFLREHPNDEKGKPYVFRHISKETADFLMSDPNVLTRHVDGKAEYVYDSASLATLGDLPKRRNAVRGFFREFPDKGDEPRAKFVALQDLTPEQREALIPQIHEFLNEWTVDRRGNERRDFAEEMAGTRGMLDGFDRLSMKGGIVLVDGKIVASTLGKQVNPNTLVVYSEKALPEVSGVKKATYQVINERFVLHMAKESLKVNQTPEAKEALNKIELWEETEGLHGLKVAEVVRLLKESKNLAEMSKHGFQPLGPAMAFWKAMGASPTDIFKKPETLPVWESLKLWSLQQGVKSLEKKGIPDEVLEKSKNPDVIQLMKAVEALRELRVAQATVAMDASPYHIKYINRQEHGGDDGHQGAKDRYAPLRMEQSWTVQSTAVAPVGIDIYADEE